jgi:hypothetical protein
MMMEVWIGLAHLKPRLGEDFFEGAVGAFVIVVAIAEDFDDFVSTAMTYLQQQHFEVVEIEDIELFREREQHYSVDQEIRELVYGLKSESPVALDTFQVYESE